MAEVYGVKPKKFTKEWWPYFWTYYKLHIFVIAFIALLAGICISDCAKKENYDLKMTYYGETTFSDADWSEIEAAMAGCIDDIDGDGEKNAIIHKLFYSHNPEFAQENEAMSVKHTASFTDKYMCLYIYDENMISTESVKENLGDLFIKADEWLYDTDGVTFDATGYGVSLKDSSVFEGTEIDADKLYLLIKRNDGTAVENDGAHKNAVIAANNLIK